MTVTKNVIRDLMPIYLAGEASADTKVLVEAYLRAHPEDSPADLDLALPKTEPPASLEMVSLERTRKLYSRRTLAFAAALALSYAVFSFRFDKSGINFIIFRDLPAAAWVLLAAAAMAWMMFFLLQKRWVETGLARSTTLFKGVWMMGGVLAVLPYAFVTSYQFGIDDVRAFCVMGAFAGAAIGRMLDRASKKS